MGDYSMHFDSTSRSSILEILPNIQFMQKLTTGYYGIKISSRSDYIADK